MNIIITIFVVFGLLVYFSGVVLFTVLGMTNGITQLPWSFLKSLVWPVYLKQLFK